MNLKLLVVDDELDIREMLSRHFRYLGYKVVEAANGQEALEILAKEKIDIVISDILMPVMPGTELCSSIRAEYPLTQVIMMTGCVKLDMAMTCLRHGAAEMIFKPLNMDELEQAVQRCVERIQRWATLLANLRNIPN